MDARQIVEGMIGILAISVVMVIWPGIRRFILGFVRNGLVGWGLLWFAGQVMGTQFQLGLNLFTSIFCGFLGLPGTVLLLVVQGYIL